MKGRLNGESEEELMASERIKLDSSERFSRIRGFQQAFISAYALHYADTIPTVKC